MCLAASVRRVGFKQSRVSALVTALFGLPLAADTMGNLYITTAVDASRLDGCSCPAARAR
ncbi:MAG TPA: hypothetical protein VNL71_11545 [Chloroflexota bacterium]|nr:hypothetical protein [Chloroflexota bacterium]